MENESVHIKGKLTYICICILPLQKDKCIWCQITNFSELQPARGAT